MNQHSYTYGHNLPKRWNEIRGDGNHILACPKHPVAKLTHLLPIRFIEDLEHNQQIAHCCRHPENHDIEAWFSCEADADRGVPDIYVFHCTCGRKHRRFMAGGGERPFWELDAETAARLANGS